jgi:hypothetical protein
MAHLRRAAHLNEERRIQRRSLRANSRVQRRVSAACSAAPRYAAAAARSLRRASGGAAPPHVAPRAAPPRPPRTPWRPGAQSLPCARSCAAWRPAALRKALFPRCLGELEEGARANWPLGGSRFSAGPGACSWRRHRPLPHAVASYAPALGACRLRRGCRAAGARVAARTRVAAPPGGCTALTARLPAARARRSLARHGGQQDVAGGQAVRERRHERHRRHVRHPAAGHREGARPHTEQGSLQRPAGPRRPPLGRGHRARRARAAPPQPAAAFAAAARAPGGARRPRGQNP